MNCQSRSDKYPNYSREEVEEDKDRFDFVPEAPANTVMGGKFDCKLYNGSRWNVSELELLVTNGTRSRRFKVYAGTTALTAGSVFVDTGLPEDESYRVAIAGATGYKPECPPALVISVDSCGLVSHPWLHSVSGLGPYSFHYI